MIACGAGGAPMQLPGLMGPGCGKTLGGMMVVLMICEV